MMRQQAARDGCDSATLPHHLIACSMVDPVSLLFFILLVNLTILAVVWQIYGPRIHVLIAKKGEKDQVLGKKSFSSFISFADNNV